MKPIRMFQLLLALSALFLWAAVAAAADMVVTGDINGTKIYDSPEGIVFDAATIQPAADVTADAAYEVTLKPGTLIATGARFVARMKDNDGLSNRCEMKYFGNLNEGPGGDFDDDDLTNLQECRIGLSPRNADTDGDGMPDGWEVQHGLNPTVNDSSADADGDGLTNLEEYQHGTDPNNPDSDGDGMPDGWEVQNGLDPLSDDANGDLDGDGYTNGVEYTFHTAANDADSKPPRYDFQYDDNGNLIQVVEH
jgi:hypothetical protein